MGQITLFESLLPETERMHRQLDRYTDRTNLAATSAAIGISTMGSIYRFAEFEALNNLTVTETAIKAAVASGQLTPAEAAVIHGGLTNIYLNTVGQIVETASSQIVEEMVKVTE